MCDVDEDGTDARGLHPPCSFSPALAELHGELVTKRRAADQLEKTLAKQYGIRQLSLKIVPKFGAIAHIASKGPSKMDDQFVVVVKSGSTRSYVVPVCSHR